MKNLNIVTANNLHKKLHYKKLVMPTISLFTFVNCVSAF